MIETRSLTEQATGLPRSKQIPAPLRLLAVIDGTERTNRILDYLVTLAQGRDAIEVIVLNVQGKRDDARLRGYQSFKQDEVDDRLVNELGAPIVGSASRWLDKAAVQNRSKVLIGDLVPTIVGFAAKEDCDWIVISAGAQNRLKRWISTTTGLDFGSPCVFQLVATANIPVVVVS